MPLMNRLRGARASTRVLWRKHEQVSTRAGQASATPPSVRQPCCRIGQTVGVVFFGLATAAWAASATVAQADSSVAALLPACHACHGRDGISVGADIPNLAGQKKDYLVNQLQAFKRGERKNELMAAIAAQLGDTEIDALATVWSQLPATSTASTRPPSIAAVASRMSFPVGFPEGFTLYETLDNVDGARVVKRYANRAALQAAREGKPLPSGAVIMVSSHAAQRDAMQKPALDPSGRLVAAELLSYAGMESRAGWGAAVPHLLRNGDWDYAVFGADRERRAELNQAECLACHKPMSASSFVFTMKALQEVASKASPRSP
jgi:cytochrome c553